MVTEKNQLIHLPNHHQTLQIKRNRNKVIVTLPHNKLKIIKIRKLILIFYNKGLTWDVKGGKPKRKQFKSIQTLPCINSIWPSY